MNELTNQTTKNEPIGQRNALSAEVMETARRIDAVLGQCSMPATVGQTAALRSIAFGRGRQYLMALMEECKADILALKNTQGGFQTDEGQGKQYSWELISGCLADAAMVGFYWTGNEINIIADRWMPVFNGLRRLASEATDAGIRMETQVEMFDVKNLRASVRVRATWTRDGQPEHLGVDPAKGVVFDGIPINAGKRGILRTEYDAVITKAKRRGYKAICEQILGVGLPRAGSDAIPVEGTLAGGGAVSLLSPGRGRIEEPADEDISTDDVRAEIRRRAAEYVRAHPELNPGEWFNSMFGVERVDDIEESRLEDALMIARALSDAEAGGDRHENLAKERE